MGAAAFLIVVVGSRLMSDASVREFLRHCGYGAKIMPVRLAWFLLGVGLLFLVGCRAETSSSAAPQIKPTSTALAPSLLKPLTSSVKKSRGPSVRPQFTNLAPECGIDFTFFSDAVTDRFFLPEVMGGGAGWIDYDGDGRLDLFLLNGRPLKETESPAPEHVHRLYRNAGKSQFQEVTHAARVAHTAYGQGCAVGDYDADGFDDLFLTAFRGHQLLRNNGDGTFEDVTTQAGVSESLWSTSAAWFDADGDGDLDLFVATYLGVTFENTKICYYSGEPGYCGPGSYQAVPDRLYVNQGDGTFAESAESLGFVGADGKGLAVVAADLDQDLRPEVYVANDMAPNFLFTRAAPAGDEPTTSPHYSEIASTAGCAVSDMGNFEASMGISCADYDGDALPDIYLTHYFNHKNTLYRNLGNLTFFDDSRRTRIVATSFNSLGFGTVPLDYDQDGAIDLFVANGHVLGPRIKPNEMAPQLLRNDGSGRFDDVSQGAGPYFDDLWLGRGAAGADMDDDGDVDLAVTHLHRPVALLRNDTPTGRNFVGVDVRPLARHRAVGGRVVVTAGERRWTKPLMTAGSYLSSGDARLLFGLGESLQPVQVEIFWPSGRTDRFENLDPNRYWVFLEGKPPRVWLGASS
jgi:hypothetical protein